MRVFAIGDVHGCSGLLAKLLGQIAEATAGEPHRIVCLGDYVDRGSDSAGAIAMLRELQASRPKGEVICLKGNHEDLMLRAAARGDEAVQLWLYNGGGRTLASYGVRRVGDMPRDALDWAARCPTAYEDERRVFVHAGLDPARDRSEQRDHDRLWIREAFLTADHDFGRYVVHGHTPLPDGMPEVRPTRVNLDTGAVYGGPLTAAIFTDVQDRPVGFLQARP